MSQIVNYDSVISARAAGLYFDHPLHYNDFTDNQIVQNGWFLPYLTYGNLGGVSSGTGLLASGGSIEWGTRIPAPVGGRQRWLTFVESTMQPAGQVLLDYLGSAAHLGYALSETGSTPTLLRYPLGDGVQIAAFPTVATTNGADVTLSVTYINQDGVGGRIATGIVTPSHPAASFIGNRFSMATGVRIRESLFMDLQDGDTGVRGITGVSHASSLGSNYISLRLVKPMAMLPPVQCGSMQHIDFLERPEGAVEMVVGSNGFLGNFGMVGGTMGPNGIYYPWGEVKLFTVEV